VQSAGLEETSFADWGVVAGACYLGRTVLAAAMAKFATSGAWSVSPHLIPNHTQHCLSGSVSVALKSHGLNLGVGGGPETVSQTFLAAASFADDDRLPGLWIVLTGHAPEPFSTTPDGATVFPVCHALALAVTPVRAEQTGDRLRVLPTARTSPNDTLGIRSNPLRVSDLTSSLAGLPGQTLRWRLDSGGWLEWQPDRVRRTTQTCTAISPSGSPV
jgi:hypothetical protein